MKKLVSVSILSAIISTGAIASDGGVYMDTQKVYHNTTNYTTADTVATKTVAADETRRIVVGHRPCPCQRIAKPAPVAVKTHSEVIDHYQVYQPVVEYVPAGTYTTRRVVSNVRPCDM